jgi:predicted dehydrogenase
MSEPNYALDPRDVNREVAAPNLPYRPPMPRRYRPKIGLVGCGGIAGTHLAAYQKAGFHVAALCSRSAETACARQKEFFPEAEVFTDYAALLQRDDIEVLDLVPHAEHRAPLIEQALRAGKHILSQKPFVVDLDLGRRLCDLADDRGVRLAVNQNGRWSPHMSWLREAARAGVLGSPLTVRVAMQWDHNWIKELAFDKIHHIILYDFAIHWFDFAASIFAGKKARRIYACVTRSAAQSATPPLLGQALVEYEGAQASLLFDGDARFGAEDRTTIVGTKATAKSSGPSLSDQQVTCYSAEGWFSPKLEGTWFTEGFQGTMGELLAAIEDNRQPLNNARDNLHSLAMCFAAVESADKGQPVAPGAVTSLPGHAM